MNWKFRIDLGLVISSLAVLSLVLVGQRPAYGQGGTGELTGTVSDPSGATISGAKVSLTNGGTGFSREMTTTAGGVDRFTALPPGGGYMLTVGGSRVRTAQNADIAPRAGTTTTPDQQ